MCADDEPLYSLSIPFSSFGASVCEILNFLDVVRDYGGSFDETFVSKGAVYEFGSKCSEFLGTYVETV